MTRIVFEIDLEGCIADAEKRRHELIGRGAELEAEIGLESHAGKRRAKKEEVAEIIRNLKSLDKQIAEGRNLTGTERAFLLDINRSSLADVLYVIDGTNRRKAGE